MRPRYRVMLVDDSPATRSSLRAFLGDIDAAEFEVAEAEHGVEALKRLTSGDPVDLVITDLTMPQMDGVELIRHLRKLPSYAEVPILFLTSHDEEERRAQVFRFGATDYVIKPFLAAELEARILGYLERRRALQTLRQSLDEAHGTQAAMMPQRMPEVAGLRVAAKWAPADRLGGDFYDFYALPGGALGILIADVSGHGVSAALVSFLVAGVLKDHATHTREPDALLRRVSEVLAGQIPQGRYATAFYATFDPSDHGFTYCAAGHPGALWVRDGDVRTLGMEGTPIGLGAAPELQRARVVLEPGDRIVLHSDGLLGGARPLAFRTIKEHLQGASEEPPESLLESLFSLGLCDGEDGGYADDVTLIVLDVVRS